jgi:TetR/AcrR family transcriptional regulator
MRGLFARSDLCHTADVTTQQPATLEPIAKADRTRAAILAAAEQEFARRGFVAARLEDVAAAVHLKRATLFYHFRDKQALYDAVTADAFGALIARLTEVFAAAGVPVIERMERAVGAWVDTVTARPTLARLILRHAAEADEHGLQALFPLAGHFVEVAWKLFEEARARGECKPLHDDPFHVASVVIGATVFYVAALAPLAPSASFKPVLTPEQVAAHKDDVLRTVRLLLGIPASKPRRTAAKAAKKSQRAR